MEIGRGIADLEKAMEIGKEIADLERAMEIGKETAGLERAMEIGKEIADLEKATEIDRGIADLEKAMEIGKEIADLEKATEIDRGIADLEKAMEIGRGIADLEKATTGKGRLEVNSQTRTKGETDSRRIGGVTTMIETGRMDLERDTTGIEGEMATRETMIEREGLEVGFQTGTELLVEDTMTETEIETVEVTERREVTWIKLVTPEARTIVSKRKNSLLLRTNSLSIISLSLSLSRSYSYHVSSLLPTRSVMRGLLYRNNISDLLVDNRYVIWVQYSVRT